MGDWVRGYDCGFIVIIGEVYLEVCLVEYGLVLLF